MRRIAAIAVLFVVAAAPARADDAVERAKAAVKIFDTLGLPDLKGLRFVKATSPGPYYADRAPEVVHGWVLREAGPEPVLLTTQLRRTSLSRVFTWRAWDRPREGVRLEDVDFVAYVAAWPHGRMAEPGSETLEVWHSIAPRVAVLAWASFKTGREMLGVRLVERAGALARGDLQAALVAELTAELRFQAVMAATRGVPRAELLRRWETIAGLGGAALAVAEAKAMIEAYRSLLAADARVEKDPVAAWRHRLCDVEANQFSQPGGCSIWYSSQEPHPGHELAKLGWAAIPALIEGLDDPRPTRCLRFSRDFDPSSYELLTLGTACAQVLEAITGLDLDDIGGIDGARRWWARREKAGPEAWFIELLTTKLPFYRRRAAVVGLLAIDPARHLPRLLRGLDVRPDAKPIYPEEREELLALVAPHLVGEHRSLVTALLGDGHPAVVRRAVRTLWERWRDDRGARQLCAREPETWSDRRETFATLTRIPCEPVVETLVASLRSADPDLRLEAIAAAPDLPDRRIVEALLPLVRDEVRHGDGFLRDGDEAALALARILGRPAPFREGTAFDARDRAIDELVAWWDEHKNTVLFSNLRKRAWAEREARDRRGRF